MAAGPRAPDQRSVRRDHERAMRRVGEALVGRYTEIGQAIAARASDEIPGYGDAAPELIEDLRAGAAATVELLARTFAAGSIVRREDLGFLRALAARRVHQGISLQAFIRAYRVALHSYWDACAEEAARLRISRDASFALASSVIDAIDTITSQAAEAYLREETRLKTQSGRAARDLVERLIQGQPVDTSRRHPAALGLDPGGRLLTIVGRVERTALAIGDALQLVRDTLEDVAMSLGTARPLAAIRHGELVLITAGTSPQTTVANLRAARQRIIDEHQIDVRCGVSTPSQGFASVEQAYREAELSLSYTSTSRPGRLARRLLITRVCPGRCEQHHQSNHRLQGQQPADTPRSRPRGRRAHRSCLLRRQPQRRQRCRTDARPPEHRPIPAPTDRHQKRPRSPHVQRPRGAHLHPRDH